jgi:bidirectional [NiFe] hydrogenase diaphorase subunit
MTVASRTGSPAVPADDPRLRPVLVAIKRHRHRPDSLLEVLHTAQEVFGHLPREVLWYVARQLRLPPSRVYGVATFYHFFSLTPRGAHSCVVCTGTACYIKGAAGLLTAAERDAGLPAGRTSADGAVSLSTARCLGACGVAPAALFDGRVVGHLTPAAVVSQIREWQGDGPG